MLCEVCKIKKIGPKTPPFGYFFCKADHMQCVFCNNNTRGLCAQCAQETEFVSMTIEPVKKNSLLQEEETKNISACSLIPFSRKKLADIEKLPQISQETINLYRSDTSLFQLSNEVNQQQQIQQLPIKLVLQFWSENDIVHVKQVREPTNSHKEIAKPRKLLKEHMKKQIDYSKQKDLLKKNAAKYRLRCKDA